MEPQLCSDSDSECIGVTKVTANNSSLTMAPSKMGLIIYLCTHIEIAFCHQVRQNAKTKRNTPFYNCPMRFSANYVVFA